VEPAAPAEAPCEVPAPATAPSAEEPTIRPAKKQKNTLLSMFGWKKPKPKSQDLPSGLNSSDLPLKASDLPPVEAVDSTNLEVLPSVYVRVGVHAAGSEGPSTLFLVRLPASCTAERVLTALRELGLAEDGASQIRHRSKGGTGKPKALHLDAATRLHNGDILTAVGISSPLVVPLESSQEPGKGVVEHPVLLEDCIAHLLAEEKLEGENSWDCPRCQSKQAATKRTQITSLPSVLVIKLKRVFGVQCVEPGVFASTRCRDVVVACPLEGLRLKEGPDTVQQTSQRYNLLGCINHGAARGSGHYTSTVSCCDKWFACNDDRVREIGAGSVISSTADLLLYQTGQFT